MGLESAQPLGRFLRSCGLVVLRTVCPGSSCSRVRRNTPPTGARSCHCGRGDRRDPIPLRQMACRRDRWPVAGGEPWASGRLLGLSCPRANAVPARISARVFFEAKAPGSLGAWNQQILNDDGSRHCLYKRRDSEIASLTFIGTIYELMRASMKRRGRDSNPRQKLPPVTP